MAFELPFSSKKATKEVKALGKATDKTVDSIEEATKESKQLEKQISKVGKKAGMTKSQMANLGKTLSKVKVAVGLVAAAFVAFGAVILTKQILRAIQEYREFEAGLVGVGKTADISGQALDEMGQRISEMSLRIPVATKELLAIAQSAGQLGVKGSENILKFTEVIAKVTRATDLTAEAASTSFARILSVTGESIGSVDKLASVIVRLGNDSKATESDITFMTNEIVKAVGIFDVSSANAAAFSAALKEMGTQAELGRSALGRTFFALDRITKGGGAKLEELSKVVGLTGEQFKKTFEEDSARAFQIFIEGIGKIVKNKGPVEDTLKAFGLSGQAILNVLPALAKNSGILAEKMKLANDELKNATALNKEVARSFATLDSKIIIAGNRWDDLRKDIGKEFELPVLEILNEFGQFIKDNKKDIIELAKNLASIAQSIISITLSEITVLKESERVSKEQNKAFFGFFSDIGDSLTDFFGSLTGANFEPIKKEIKEIDKEVNKLAESAAQLNGQQVGAAGDKKKRILKLQLDTKEAEKKLNDFFAKIKEERAIRISDELFDEEMFDEATEFNDDFANDYREKMEAANKAVTDNLQQGFESAVASLITDLAAGSKTAGKDFAAALGGAAGFAAGGPIGAAIGSIIGGSIGQTLFGGRGDTDEAGSQLAQTLRELDETAKAFNQSFKESFDTVSDTVGRFKDAFIRSNELQKELNDIEEKLRIEAGRQETQRTADLRMAAGELTTEITKLAEDAGRYRETVLSIVQANLMQVESIKQQTDDLIADTAKRDFTIEQWQQQLETSLQASRDLGNEIELLTNDLENLNADQLLELAELSEEAAQVQADVLEAFQKILDDTLRLRDKIQGFLDSPDQKFKGMSQVELTAEVNKNIALLNSTTELTNEELETLFDETNILLGLIEQSTREQLQELKGVKAELERTQKNIFDKILEITLGSTAIDQTFQAKEAIFRDLVQTALATGAVGDIDTVLNLIPTILQDAQNALKSSPEFQDFFNFIMDTLASFGTVTQAQIETVDLAIVNLELNDTLTDLTNQFKDSLEPRIDELTLSIINLTNAVTGGTATSPGVAGHTTGTTGLPGLGEGQPIILMVGDQEIKGFITNTVDTHNQDGANRGLF